MNENLCDAVVSVLDELAEAGTNIKTNKYDVFREARKRANINVRYSDVKNDIRNAIIDFCIKHGYSFTTMFNGKFFDYQINTEVIEKTVAAATRNRVYIPAEYVRNAGFKPGEYVYVAKYENENGVTYNITRGTPDFQNAEIVRGATVEKHGGIRFAIDTLLAFDDYNMSSVAGMIILDTK